MATPRKSAKRSATKKRPAAKRQAGRTKKSPTTKKKSKRKSASRTAGLKRQARKGLKAAKGGLSSVMQAGGKTWQTLKSTTTQVVEGVKETLASEPASGARRRSR